MTGFGTYKLEKGEQAINSVSCAMESGYNHLDTASLYGTEKSIAGAFQKTRVPREKIWITSKVHGSDIKKGVHKVEKSIQKSLKNLNTDYLDLILLHFPLSDTEANLNAWYTLENYHRQGYVRHIGLSNYREDNLNLILENGSVRPFTNQIEVTPFCQRLDLVKHCQENGIGITAHSSLVKGQKLDHPILVDMANKNRISPAQVLLQWSKQKGYTIIPRSQNQVHIVENFEEVSDLSEEEMELLDTLDENYATHPQYLQ